MSWYTWYFYFGLILYFNDYNDGQIILQDSLLDNACQVEIGSVYRLLLGGHLLKFINIGTLQQHSNNFSTVKSL